MSPGRLAEAVTVTLCPYCCFKHHKAECKQPLRAYIFFIKNVIHLETWGGVEVKHVFFQIVLK